MVVSLHLENVSQTTTIRTSTKSFILVAFLSFASMVLLKPFMPNLNSVQTDKCNYGWLHLVKMSFIINLILILNQSDTHHLLYTFYSFIIISILCRILTHKHIDWGGCSYERANLYLLTYIYICKYQLHIHLYE